MPFGLFAPLPIRLGGSDAAGWSATDHARMCADLVAAKRAAPIAVFTYTLAAGVVTMHSYLGQNGAGTAYAPDSIVIVGTGIVTFTWTTGTFTDAYEIEYPIAIKTGRATGHGATDFRGLVTVFANGVTVKTVNSAGTATDGKVTVKLS